MDQAENPFFYVRESDEDIKIAEKLLDDKILSNSFSGNVELTISNQLHVNVDGLSSKIVRALRKTATFANPKYFELQRLRLSTWKTPKYIFCGELLEKVIILPRGSLDACVNILKDVGANIYLKDERSKHKKFKLNFEGELLKEQKEAVHEMLKHDTGVLMAPTGSGKTVMACNIIAKRKVPTLILTHRTQLIDQWKKNLSEFLGLSKKQIGTYSGASKKLTYEIDIATLQTITKLTEDKNVFSAYGQVIIDECHHVPAFSFESVLKQFNSKYFLGLTATPYRKDGHQPIIFMQCGCIRHELSESKHLDFRKYAIIKETGFRMPNPESGYQHLISDIWAVLVMDEDRLKLIADDVVCSLKEKRFPLIISERKDHLNLISQRIRVMTEHLQTKEFVFIGGMGKKARSNALREIEECLTNNVRPYILATGSFIGEGFDLPQLDTLIITMPISFKGKLIQYAGRINRRNENKNDIRIYDYLDEHLTLTKSMFKKRLITYRKMGYEISIIKQGAVSAQNKLSADL